MNKHERDKWGSTGGCFAASRALFLARCLHADGWALVSRCTRTSWWGGFSLVAVWGCLFRCRDWTPLPSPNCKWCGIATLGLANQVCFLQLFGSPVSTRATRFLELNLCELQAVSAKSVKLLWIPTRFHSQACEVRRGGFTEKRRLVRKLAIISKQCWSGVGCAPQTLPAASWKMLSWLRQENISLDFEIVKEATGISVETCRSSAVGAPVDSAAKEM